MVDTDMTSDILIYNILKNSNDEFIKECNVKFIDRSVPAEEDDTIYIANVDLETHQELFDGVEYRALVNVYVKTKDTDYISSSRLLSILRMFFVKMMIANKEAYAFATPPMNTVQTIP